jgi:hypothetical protein
VFNETNRTDVLADLVRWLDARIPAPVQDVPGDD